MNVRVANLTVCSGIGRIQVDSYMTTCAGILTGAYLEHFSSPEQEQDWLELLFVQFIEQGGHYDEYDLHKQPGGYIRLMDKNAVGRICPVCERNIEKIQYLSGAGYICPGCQMI